MFRSGTTLVARMLNVHPAITLASDPLAPLFKEFRNAVMEQVLGYREYDRDAPLDDYYFDPIKRKIYTAVRDTRFALESKPVDIEKLRRRLAEAAHPYSPAVVPLFKDLTGSTFEELISSGFDIVETAYGSEDAKYVGIKEVWTGEFTPHFLEAFPDSRVIHIVRDPRAVCASKNVTNEQYPVIFLARQWRKLASLAELYSRREPDRVKLVKYEDLIRSPEEVSREICDFLGIEFHPNLVDPSTFVDGSGKPWKQNSFHFEGLQRFNIDSLDRWKTAIPEETIALIETLCWFEMKLKGYEISYNTEGVFEPELVFSPPEADPDRIAEWIKPYILQNPAHELGVEYVRNDVLRSGKQPPPETITALCLENEIFQIIQDGLKG